MKKRTLRFVCFAFFVQDSDSICVVAIGAAFFVRSFGCALFIFKAKEEKTMLLNCKFCGNELKISENDKITTCKYCRTTQTLPVIKDEHIGNLFNRANDLRRRCDLDKAEAAFEKLIEADGTEAEAYWGLVLSKHGIEYVEDPESGKMLPTCHRASYDSIVSDGDYKSALEYADEERRAIYVEQAKEIYRITELDKNKEKLSSYNIVSKQPCINVGDVIKFGRYKQSSENKSYEDIEWKVLDRQGNKALIISKYSLDCKRYNEINTEVTWELCTLRKWLNNDFINTAFTDKEKSLILTVTVSAGENPSFNSNPGNPTQDKIFLLSISEANKYFASSAARECKPTEYAKMQGAYTDTSIVNCWWWLRSPGLIQLYASYVAIIGFIDEFGLDVASNSGAVRPAMWIDLNA